MDREIQIKHFHTTQRTTDPHIALLQLLNKTK
jgi:hypothetical protein